MDNPMNDIMMGNMPGMPDIIKNAMPVTLPRMNYNDSAIGMILGNFKRTRFYKASDLEARIAENSCRTLQAKFTAIHEVITFSAKVNDTLGVYEHNKTLRALEIKEKEADIYIKTAQARQMGFEAQLSELDYNIKLKQYQKMEATYE